MYDETTRALLQKPLLARMSVIDSNGYPHTIPVWFGVDGDDIIVTGWSETRKVKYLQANPKGSVSIGGDMNDGGGCLIKGEFVIEPDVDHTWLNKLTRHYEDAETAAKHIQEWADLDIVIMRLKPHSVHKI
jgi:general stress protein 26